MADTDEEHNTLPETKKSIVNYGQVRVHPCVIDGQAHIVYPRGLREHSPILFEKLSRYFHANGYRLKEDQRSRNDSVHHNKRRRWAQVVLFSASLMFEGTVSAGFQSENDNTPSNPTQKIELRIMPKHLAHIPDKQSGATLNDLSVHEMTKVHPGIAEAIFTTLHAHYNSNNTDPEYVTDDLKQIANYYSQFPQVISLLESLKDKNWKLVYDEDNWDTVAIGNTMQVNKAIVHFNTRSAAQLLLNRKCKDNPVCIASPADALLHELLHTYSMLVDTTQFIDEGGMNNMLYPYEHEYAIIDAERKLYASMTRVDDLKRPQRTDHTGRNIFAHCPVCIK